ncbi:hypothetical protein [Priestia koreensis]|uniref:hypothetical protein n=1 Tax=Priestia koreensis TaxID=284581 RepID=UPI003457631A
MKKWIVALFVGILLIGCSNEEESVSKPPPPPLEEKKDQPVPQEIYSLPDFGTTALPVQKVLKKDGTSFSHFPSMYVALCWNDCESNPSVMKNYPSPLDKDNYGDTLQVDWRALEPQPTEVYLLKSKSSDRETIVSREKQDVSGVFQLVITDDTIENNYALEFSWKDHDQLIGRSQFNFGIQ